ncbi:hypothetical protein PROFUN_10807, partial [Planoprotostelium fungivorum]
MVFYGWFPFKRLEEHFPHQSRQNWSAQIETSVEGMDGLMQLNQLIKERNAYAHEPLSSVNELIEAIENQEETDRVILRGWFRRVCMKDTPSIQVQELGVDTIPKLPIDISFEELMKKLWGHTRQPDWTEWTTNWVRWATHKEAEELKRLYHVDDLDAVPEMRLAVTHSLHVDQLRATVEHLQGLVDHIESERTDLQIKLFQSQKENINLHHRIIETEMTNTCLQFKMRCMEERQRGVYKKRKVAVAEELIVEAYMIPASQISKYDGMIEPNNLSFIISVLPELRVSQNSTNTNPTVAVVERPRTSTNNNNGPAHGTGGREDRNGRRDDRDHPRNNRRNNDNRRNDRNDRNNASKG